MNEIGRLPTWRLILLLFLASLTSTAGASKRATVAQLEQVLIAAHTAHKSDSDIARQVGSLELSERLTEASLVRLTAYVDTGSQAALALRLLADQSTFLDPPAAELPPAASPDEPMQQRVIEAARKYVTQILLQLPNLFAVRTTNRYDDRPHEIKKGSWPVRAGLHLVSTSRQESSVFNEKANQAMHASPANRQEQSGLVSGGEFGSTLAMILSDTVSGQIAWSHWEQSPIGQLAVFHYSVPSSASHFELINSLHQQPSIEGSSTRPVGSYSSTIITRPGYYGSLWVDPSTGTILRLTLEADTKGNIQFKRAGIMVQYGPVQIGDSKFICPVRSVALSMAASGADLDPITRIPGDAPTIWMNESVFTAYHRFGVTTRIVKNAEEPRLQDNIQTSRLREVSPPIDGVASNPVEAIPDESRQANVPDLPALQPNASTISAPSSEVSTAPAPTQQAQASQEAPPKIVVNVNRVLVPVVVRDKQGHTVGDLKKEDFQVFENGKPQTISGFTIEKHEATASARGSDIRSPALVSTPNASPEVTVLPKRITVYLFDDLHMSSAELAYFKKMDAKVLNRALIDSDMAAIVSTSGKINSGLTRDRAKLHDAIMSLKPQSLFTSTAGECPQIEYYQADLIENKHDSTASGNALAQVFACNPSLDKRRDLDQAQRIVESTARRVLAVGDQDVQVTLAAIKEFVSRMAKLPGQRSVVLVSPGFVSITPEALNWESQIVDLAVQSGVTINALDARGLYTGVTDISKRRVDQIIDPTPFAAMTRAEGTMSELTDGTGGAFFHNNNDLETGFRRLTDLPEIVYILEISLDGVKPDGAYHRMKVQVDREDIQMQARQGYSAPQKRRTRNRNSPLTDNNHNE